MALPVPTDNQCGPVDKRSTLQVVTLEYFVAGDCSAQSTQLVIGCADQFNLRDERLVKRRLDVNVPQPESQRGRRHRKAQRQECKAQQSLHDCPKVLE